MKTLETMSVWHPKKGKLTINVKGSVKFIAENNCSLEEPKKEAKKTKFK